MTIKTSKEIKTKYLNDTLKVYDVIVYLINKGFNSEKDPFYTSLSELSLNGLNVSKLSINSEKIKITFKK